MAGRIATKAYCNSIAGTSVFTGDLNECPTYSEIIGTKKFTVSGLHDNNQLVLQSEISKSAIAKVKFGFYTTNTSTKYYVLMQNFRVVSDSGDSVVFNNGMDLNSNSWGSDSSSQKYRFKKLGELTGSSISSSGIIEVNGFPINQDWKSLGSSIIDMGLLIDVNNPSGGGGKE